MSHVFVLIAKEGYPISNVPSVTTEVTTMAEAITYFANQKNITEEEITEQFNITQIEQVDI